MRTNAPTMASCTSHLHGDRTALHSAAHARRHVPPHLPARPLHLSARLLTTFMASAVARISHSRLLRSAPRCSARSTRARTHCASLSLINVQPLHCAERRCPARPAPSFGKVRVLPAPCTLFTSQRTCTPGQLLARHRTRGFVNALRKVLTRLRRQSAMRQLLSSAELCCNERF